jgi:diguanylate cyclase (GGDEF)-like protein
MKLAMDSENSSEPRAATAALPDPVSKHEAEVSLAASTKQLWERFQGTMLERVAVLERAAVALLDKSLDQDLRRQAEREAHKLAGSLGMYGYPLGTAWAREIEQVLIGDAHLLPAQALRLSELVVALRPHLEQPSAESRLRIAEPAQRMLMISDDAELAKRVATESAARGLNVQRTTVSGLEKNLGMMPTIILLDVEAAKSPMDALATVADQWPEVPLLVLAVQDSLADRVEVTRWGSQAFLQKPATPSQILEVAAQILQRAAADKGKILVVDDDPQVLEALEVLLPSQGFAVVTHGDPLTFWQALEDTAPDLLLLDIDMPGLSGIQLCHEVRSDPRWCTLPILFLISHTDPRTVYRVFAVRADDYVPKPFAGPELLARIRNRLERMRLQRSLIETDALTGVATRSKSEQVLAQLLKLADRHNQPISLAVLDVDKLKRINSREGHAAGDAVLQTLGQILRHSFRGEDIVARWAGEEFVAVMYGMTRTDGVRRLAAILAEFQKKEFSSEHGDSFGATFSAGVAEYPVDGATLQDLYRAADGALFHAKGAGSNRVLPAGWQGDQAPVVNQVDVVLIDDDEALSALLAHTLKIRGYTTHILKDGQAAVEALCGREPRLKAKVILLEVSLPGLDGFGVLRQLASDHILRRTKVIVLTARSLEAEVLKTLELGAFDHLAKPFSMPVLMQLVRRAIEL